MCYSCLLFPLVICLWWHIWLGTSTKQSPSWQANSCSPRQEIPCILRNTNVHYLIHNSPSSVPILSQIDPDPTLTSYLKMYLNVILPSTFISSKWSLILGLRHQKSLFAFPLPPHLTQTPPIWVLLHLIWVMKLTRRWSPNMEGVREYIESGTGWSPSLGLGEGLRTPHPRNLIYYELFKKASVTHWNDT